MTTLIDRWQGFDDRPFPAEAAGEVNGVNLKSIESFGAMEVPSGRKIWVIWRYDREDDEIPDVFGELADPAIFVITAY